MRIDIRIGYGADKKFCLFCLLKNLKKKKARNWRAKIIIMSFVKLLNASSWIQSEAKIKSAHNIKFRTLVEKMCYI